jgi:hypothetical protein
MRTSDSEKGHLEDLGRDEEEAAGVLGDERLHERQVVANTTPITNFATRGTVFKCLSYLIVY